LPIVLLINKLLTLERFASALGKKVEIRLV
jgi:hypothetical protein